MIREELHTVVKYLKKIYAILNVHLVLGLGDFFITLAEIKFFVQKAYSLIFIFETLNIVSPKNVYRQLSWHISN